MSKLWDVAFGGATKVDGYSGRLQSTSSTNLSKYNSRGARATIGRGITQAIAYRVGRPIWVIETNDFLLVEMETHSIGGNTYRTAVKWERGDELKVAVLDRPGNDVAVPDSDIFREKGSTHPWAHAILWLPFLFEANDELEACLNKIHGEFSAMGQFSQTPELFIACDNTYCRRSEYDIDTITQVSASSLGLAYPMQIKGYNSANVTDSYLAQFVAPPAGSTATSTSSTRSRRRSTSTASSGHDFFEKYRLPWKKKLSAEHQKLVPNFDSGEIELDPNIEHAAEMIFGEYGSKRPVKNVLLYGEAGAGKSTAAQLLAQAFGLPYRYFNASLNSEESTLTGSFMPQEDGNFRFVSTEFLEAAKHGGVIEIMEPNYMKAGALGILNSFLEKPFSLVSGNGEMIERHPNCIVVATTNVNYAGTLPMNEAIIDRFQIIQEVNKLTKDQLASIVVRETGFSDRGLLGKLIDAVETISAKIRAEELGGVCSTRKLIDWARDIKYSRDPKASAWRTILPGISLEKDVQQEIFDTCLKPTF